MSRCAIAALTFCLLSVCVSFIAGESLADETKKIPAEAPAANNGCEREELPQLFDNEPPPQRRREDAQSSTGATQREFFSAEVCENQRLSLRGFSASNLLPSDRRAYTDRVGDGKDWSRNGFLQGPEAYPVKPGWMWLEPSWKKSGGGDDHWDYALDFSRSFYDVEKTTSLVRRRCWTRTMMRQVDGTASSVVSAMQRLHAAFANASSNYSTCDVRIRGMAFPDAPLSLSHAESVHADVTVELSSGSGVLLHQQQQQQQRADGSGEHPSAAAAADPSVLSFPCPLSLIGILMDCAPAHSDDASQNIQLIDCVKFRAGRTIRQCRLAVTLGGSRQCATTVGGGELVYFFPCEPMSKKQLFLVDAESGLIFSRDQDVCLTVRSFQSPPYGRLVVSPDCQTSSFGAWKVEGMASPPSSPSSSMAASRLVPAVIEQCIAVLPATAELCTLEPRLCVSEVHLEAGSFFGPSSVTYPVFLPPRAGAVSGGTTRLVRMELPVVAVRDAKAINVLQREYLLVTNMQTLQIDGSVAPFLRDLAPAAAAASDRASWLELVLNFDIYALAARVLVPSKPVSIPKILVLYDPDGGGRQLVKELDKLNVYHAKQQQQQQQHASSSQQGKPSDGDDGAASPAKPASVASSLSDELVEIAALELPLSTLTRSQLTVDVPDFLDVLLHGCLPQGYAFDEYLAEKAKKDRARADRIQACRAGRRATAAAQGATSAWLPSSVMMLAHGSIIAACGSHGSCAVGDTDQSGARPGDITGGSGKGAGAVALQPLLLETIVQKAAAHGIEMSVVLYDERGSIVADAPADEQQQRKQQRHDMLSPADRLEQLSDQWELRQFLQRSQLLHLYDALRAQGVRSFADLAFLKEGACGSSAFAAGSIGYVDCLKVIASRQTYLERRERDGGRTMAPHFIECSSGSGGRVADASSSSSSAGATGSSSNSTPGGSSDSTALSSERLECLAYKMAMRGSSRTQRSHAADQRAEVASLVEIWQSVYDFVAPIVPFLWNLIVTLTATLFFNKKVVPRQQQQQQQQQQLNDSQATPLVGAPTTSPTSKRNTAASARTLAHDSDPRSPEGTGGSQSQRILEDPPPPTAPDAAPPADETAACDTSGTSNGTQDTQEEKASPANSTMQLRKRK